jgi:hypothetical protein
METMTMSHTILAGSAASRRTVMFGMFAALGLGACAGSESSTPGAYSSQPLKAGAGTGEIVFPATMFADPSAIEGFGGTILDHPHASLLVLETDIRVAIVSLELVRVDADGIALVKDIVNRVTSTPSAHVWVHANHTISTPHEPVDATLKALWMSALEGAITAAAHQAAASFQPALLGFASGTSDIHVNRNVMMSDGQYHIGLDGTLPSTKTMTVMGVRAVATGKPIGFLLSHGVKPTALDNAGMSTGIRQISADVPGVACRMMEQALGAPALFLMGATADQIPKYDGYRAKDDGTGTVTDNYDYARDVGLSWIIEQMQALGSHMGTDAIAVARQVTYTVSHPKIARAATSFDWPAVSTGTLTAVPLEVLRVGDAAFVGFKPELDDVTGQQLQTLSARMGYSQTLLAAFMNGDAKYMPHAQAYVTPLTVEGKKAGFTSGAAEQLVSTAANLLHSMLR